VQRRILAVSEIGPTRRHGPGIPEGPSHRYPEDCLPPWRERLQDRDALLRCCHFRPVFDRTRPLELPAIKARTAGYDFDSLGGQAGTADAAVLLKNDKLAHRRREEEHY